QRDPDDRGVHDDDELRERDDRQSGPPTRMTGHPLLPSSGRHPPLIPLPGIRNDTGLPEWSASVKYPRGVSGARHTEVDIQRREDAPLSPDEANTVIGFCCASSNRTCCSASRVGCIHVSASPKPCEMTSPRLWSTAYLLVLYT